MEEIQGVNGDLGGMEEIQGKMEDIQGINGGDSGRMKEIHGV